MSEYEKIKPHRMYTGEPEVQDYIMIDEGNGPSVKAPIRLSVVKPTLEDGTQWDQTNDAAEHMRYAATLRLPELSQSPTPRRGTAIIVGGSPSVKDHLNKIRELKKDPNNILFAINWTHTWLLNNDIRPDGLVFFEIDIEPDTVLKKAHKGVTYYICSHCDPRTFDQLKDFKRVLWHSYPGSVAESKARDELFPISPIIGGGIYTLTRTITIALFLGYRDFELFGCDSSFPDEGSTHVEGYETIFDPEKDGLYVYAKYGDSDKVARFKTTASLALQHEEFKEYCRINHGYYTMRVYGDGLIPWSHRMTYPSQYEKS